VGYEVEESDPKFMYDPYPNGADAPAFGDKYSLQKLSQGHSRPDIWSTEIFGLGWKIKDDGGRPIGDIRMYPLRDSRTHYAGVEYVAWGSGEARTPRESAGRLTVPPEKDDMDMRDLVVELRAGVRTILASVEKQAVFKAAGISS
jgi:hypothetical protein